MKAENRDVSDHKQANKAVYESESFLAVVLDSMPANVAVLDGNGKIIAVNAVWREFAQRNGATSSDNAFLGFNYLDICRKASGSSSKGALDCLRGLEDLLAGETNQFDLEYPCHSPVEDRWFLMRAVPRIEGVGVVVTHINITEQKRAELSLYAAMSNYQKLAAENTQLLEQARQDAESMSRLLQEVNHRVKNNLSLIIGMLYIEQRFAKQIPTERMHAAIMKDLITRIEGLATVHQLLSASQWSPISSLTLTEKIIKSASQGTSIHTTVESRALSNQSVEVSPAQANGLAIVINELATNVVKYVVPMQEESTRINVLITPTANALTLEFRDNGPGFPEDVLRSEIQGMGLHLINNIVRYDLKGKIQVSNDHGAVVNLHFPHLLES